MEKRKVIDFPVEEIVERITRESTNQILKILQKSVSKDEREILEKELTRKETAEYLGVSPPTIDRYTDEGLLKKYGAGKRARYILTEVENAKPLIMESLHKWKLPPARSYRK
jgi:excisionase family DNA binding protein